jgi:hypothetical protein
MKDATAKRDTWTTCPVCGEVFRQDGIGRMRKFCSDACKQKAHRRTIARNPVRKELNTVRTDYLEQQIAFYEARRDFVTVDAMRGLARHVSAPISEKNVTYWREVFSQEIGRFAAL